MKAFKPFTGSSTHGFGKIRKSKPSDCTIYKFIFETEKGDMILFDTVHDNQVKGIIKVEKLDQFSLDNLT